MASARRPSPTRLHQHPTPHPGTPQHHDAHGHRAHTCTTHPTQRPRPPPPRFMRRTVGSDACSKNLLFLVPTAQIIHQTLREKRHAWSREGVRRSTPPNGLASMLHPRSHSHPIVTASGGAAGRPSKKIKLKGTYSLLYVERASAHTHTHHTTHTRTHTPSQSLSLFVFWASTKQTSSVLKH